MGTVSGPFLIIRRNLSVVFDGNDDTRAFPPDLLDVEEEDATMVFLNRADSFDSVAVFEDIEAAEDDAVRNMTTMMCSSLSIYFSLPESLLAKRNISFLLLLLLLFCSFLLPVGARSRVVCVCACSGLPSLFCSKHVSCFVEILLSLFVLPHRVFAYTLNRACG
jgi:hypothetical protein